MSTFTLSSTKYGLFEVTPDSPIKADEGGELALRLFILNADSEKAVNASTSLIEAVAKLAPAAKKAFLLKVVIVIVAKPKADIKATIATDKADVKLRLTVTGEKMLERAKAIIALRTSDVKPETLQAASKTGTRKMGEGLAAGLMR